MCVFSGLTVRRMCCLMNWQMIRLELASNGEFPRGSAARIYLMRLPLAEGGRIDNEKLKAEPGRAVVRRYWANEADMIGHLITTPSGLAIRYETNARVDGQLFSFHAQAIRTGDRVSLTDVDGRERQFRVASLG